MGTIKQDLHAGAGQALSLEHPALQAGDMRHTSIEDMEERAAEALGIAGHEWQQVDTHLNSAQVSGFAQRDCILYVLVHFHVVVACKQGAIDERRWKENKRTEAHLE